MTIEDKFKGYDPFFLKKLKEEKKNFSKEIREYKVYFKKGGKEGIVKKNGERYLIIIQI